MSDAASAYLLLPVLLELLLVQGLECGTLLLRKQGVFRLLSLFTYALALLAVVDGWLGRACGWRGASDTRCQPHTSRTACLITLLLPAAHSELSRFCYLSGFPACLELRLCEARLWRFVDLDWSIVVMCHTTVHTMAADVCG